MDEQDLQESSRQVAAISDSGQNEDQFVINGGTLVKVQEQQVIVVEDAHAYVQGYPIPIFPPQIMVAEPKEIDS